MRRVAQPAFVGARGLDCDTPITPAFAQWMVDNDFAFACRYLGSLTSLEIDILHAHGRAVMPVCFADKFDGMAAVGELVGVHMPLSVTTWSDTESIQSLDAPALIKRLDEGFAIPVRKAGWDPGGYFANDTLLTSVELGSLILDHYWQGGVQILDRFNKLAEPTLETGAIGWVMKQCCPGNLREYRGRPTPALIDIDFIYEDYRRRTPTWCVGIPSIAPDVGLGLSE